MSSRFFDITIECKHSQLDAASAHINLRNPVVVRRITSPLGHQGHHISETGSVINRLNAAHLKVSSTVTVLFRSKLWRLSPRSCTPGLRRSHTSHHERPSRSRHHSAKLKRSQTFFPLRRSPSDLDLNQAKERLKIASELTLLAPTIGRDCRPNVFEGGIIVSPRTSLFL